MPLANAFTVVGGLAKVLQTTIRIGQAFDPNTATTNPILRDYSAIWDTGATASAITSRVIAECGLKTIGATKVFTADGESDTDVYLVCLRLPNDIGIPSIRVTCARLTGADALIGMDIIGAGDFAVTNNAGRTYFPFRYPSCAHIDFTGKAPKVPSEFRSAGVGRNDPCPCGSTLKFKHCCGK